MSGGCWGLRSERSARCIDLAVIDLPSQESGIYLPPPVALEKRWRRIFADVWPARLNRTISLEHNRYLCRAPLPPPHPASSGFPPTAAAGGLRGSRGKPGGGGCRSSRCEESRPGVEEAGKEEENLPLRRDGAAGSQPSGGAAATCRAWSVGGGSFPQLSVPLPNRPLRERPRGCGGERRSPPAPLQERADPRASAPRAHIMGDVKLVTSTRVSKTSLTLSPSVPAEAPAFTLPPRNIRVQLGATARFEGKVRGYPEPQITWYRNGHPLSEGDHYIVDHSIRGIFSLVIKGVQEGDSGKYTCEAANDGGVRQVTVELTVEGNSLKKYSLQSSAKTSGGRLSVPPVEHRPSIWGESPPKFATKPNRVVVREGQTGKFSCKITGRPQPQVTWSKGDLHLQQNERFSMFEKTGIHFLEIQNVRLADAGIYTCTVVNSAGKASVSAELTVQGPDKSDTYAQPLWYVFTGNLSQHILGIFLSHNFDVYCMSIPHTVINFSGSVCISKIESVYLELERTNFRASGNMK
ncbi:palladin-like [Cyrtonyx montezumae]|uniref:palladin-like n=1 Tax=Cyrtonyx montezumae TaxID=9017 RepID=UPI0032DAD721